MEKTLCVICAWRENCQKRFMRKNDISLKCPDFVKDVTIKDQESVNDKGGDRKET